MQEEQRGRFHCGIESVAILAHGGKFSPSKGLLVSKHSPFAERCMSVDEMREARRCGPATCESFALDLRAELCIVMNFSTMLMHFPFRFIADREIRA